MFYFESVQYMFNFNISACWEPKMNVEMSIFLTGWEFHSAVFELKKNSFFR